MEPTESSTQTHRTFIDRYFFKLHTLKASDSFLLKAALLGCAVFFILLLIEISNYYTINIASSGGTYTEGIVGTPRFVNPVLAVTHADRDLSALIYDGLMTLGKEGVLIPSVAESITISDDGLTYNVILKDNITFHDGSPLTADDVVFTINRIQDPLLASPLRSNFDGVTVEEVNEHELNFILPEPYAPFIENLTFGILPQHVWKDAGSEEFPFSQYNSEPIGSGPYAIEKIIRNASGIPETYILKANSTFHIHEPKIETFELHFFPTEDRLIEALKKGVVEGVVGIDQSHISELALNEKITHLERIPLPRTFALFINQNKSPSLRDLSARQALNSALNRTKLVATVLGGYGNTLTNPIPKGFSDVVASSTVSDEHAIDIARDILKNGGWKLNLETGLWEKNINGTLTPLSFSIATVNNSTFEATAEFLRDTWAQLGVPVTIKQFEQSDLTQGIIRPRDYETLLFGTQLGRSLDYYSFWHSSQRNDPGLNIALYANITTDSILAEMRRSTDGTQRSDALARFSDEITKEVPAIFLYSPELLYVFPNTITGASFSGVSEPQERFAGVYDWYIETESVWPIFMK